MKAARVARGLSRRSLLAASLLAATSSASAEPETFRCIEVSAPAGRGARRALVMWPAQPAPRELPVLVLLHGLGETRSQEAGLRAWPELYGLKEAWKRLSSTGLPRDKPAEVSELAWESHARVHAERPFLGLCVVCPFMPNPYAGDGADPRLEGYAQWLEEALLPAVRARIPEASSNRARTGVAGVSLGGVAAIEVALRRPGLFGNVGTVQGAFSVERARSYARELAAASDVGPPTLYVATSTFDPYRAANLLLGREASELGIPSTTCSRGGAHSQDWLRRIGSLDLLAFYDRALFREETRGPFRWKPCSEG